MNGGPGQSVGGLKRVMPTQEIVLEMAKEEEDLLHRTH
jgi:hypothetical protein